MVFITEAILYGSVSLISDPLPLVLCRPGVLCVENPLQPDVDMGRGSYNMPKVRRAFEHAHQVLLVALTRAQSQSESVPSVLAHIIRSDDSTLASRAQVVRRSAALEQSGARKVPRRVRDSSSSSDEDSSAASENVPDEEEDMCEAPEMSLTAALPSHAEGSKEHSNGSRDAGGRRSSGKKKQPKKDKTHTRGSKKKRKRENNSSSEHCSGSTISGG